MKSKLVSILIISFLIRLISLNQSLWLDEATTAKVTQLSFGQIFTQFSPTDFHPPLYYLLMKVWTSLFGISEISLRLPSVIFSLLTGWIIYKIGSMLANKTVGMWAAAIFLFNPLIIYYSQEARMYSLITLLLTVSFYYFLLIIKHGSFASLRMTEKAAFTREIKIFNIFTGLSFLTFYASIYFLAAFYIYVLYRRNYSLLFRLLPGFIISMLIVSPLLYSQLLNARQVLGEIKNWSLVLGKVTVKNFALIPLKFATGRITFYPKILYYIIGGIWTIEVLLATFKASLKHKLLVYFLVVPLGLGLLFSFITPMLQYFRFIYLIPLMSLLIALSAKKEWQRYVVLGGFIIFSSLYLLSPQHHREDWKSLGLYLKIEKKPVYMITSASDPVKYYAPNTQIFDIRSVSGMDPLPKHLIVIPYVTDIHGVDYASSLKARGYSNRETINLRGVTAERWALDPVAFYTRKYSREQE